MTKTYTVTTERWEHGWELHVDGVGVTQCGPLADAERMALDYLATELGDEAEDYTVEIHHDIGGVGAKVAEVRQRMAEAQQAVDAAAADMRKVARELRSEGISVRDSAVILDVSPGRVSQLVKGKAARVIAGEVDSDRPAKLGRAKRSRKVGELV